MGKPVKNSREELKMQNVSKIEERRNIHVRIVLENELLEAFLAIKKELGIKNNTEIVRFLIKEKAKEIKEKSLND